MMKFHNIEPNNIENGIGIRTVLWVSGCFHSCHNCQNPITHDPTCGVEFDDNAMNELIESIRPEHIHGLTLSGGDPLCYYPDEILDVIKEVRKEYGNTKTIWLYTGYTIEHLCRLIVDNVNPNRTKIFDEILRSIDVLCEGPYIESQSSKEYNWVGSTNQRVINMKESIEKREIVFFTESEKEKWQASILFREVFNAPTDIFREWTRHKV